ncbi:hypothetical protein SAY86_002945 [Trapa natans]|uniref:Fe2OG dioxygenase domain-containing protein n=1 Tax=Trapa natans TaxID=22666 RepID=A0AAN7R3V9_TRANT|nr:hypothetical protein SAY86_002945 [Trapa natans]
MLGLLPVTSWAKGASIGWHSDDNREYLKQRDFSAVCYLNSHGESFRGGLFHFKDGELQTVVPSAGDLLIYTADSNNIHSVEEVTDGERLTLTLWFSRNSTHDEDMKLISRLSQIYLNEESCRSFFPFPAPASSNMYLFSREQSFHEEFGINICFARLLVLGFSIYSSSDENLLEERCDILLKPLKLTRSDKLLSYEFSNILHALQVVQYYLWKSWDLPRPESTLSWGKVTELSHPQKEKVDKLKLALIKDHKLAWETFGFRCHESTELQDFNWACFSVAITAWEDYTSEKHKDLIRSLPHWINYQSIFCASFDTV